MIANTFTYRDGISGPAESAYNSRVEDKKKEQEEESNNSFSSQMEQSNINAKNVQTTPTLTTPNKTEPETENQTKEETSDSWAMFEDIKSLMKTGLSKDDLETLDKLMKMIQDEMKEDPPNQMKIKDMIIEIQKAIAELKKKVTGEAVIGLEDNPIRHSSSSLKSSEKNSLGNNTTNIDTTGIEQGLMDKIKDIKGEISKLKEGRHKDTKISNNSSSEQLELFNAIKNFQQR